MPENEEPEKTEQAITRVSEQTAVPSPSAQGSASSQPASLMTQEQFSAQMTALTERAREAGLRPIQAMLTTYLKLGATMLDKMLEGLEPVDKPKGKE